MNVFDLVLFEKDFLRDDFYTKYESIISKCDTFYQLEFVWNKYFITMTYFPEIYKSRYTLEINDSSNNYRNKKIINKIKKVVIEEEEKRKRMFFNIFIEYLLNNRYVIYIDSASGLNHRISVRCHTNDYLPLIKDCNLIKLDVGLCSKKARLADCIILLEEEPLLIFQEKKRRFINSLLLLRDHSLEFLLLKDASEKEINTFIKNALPKNYLRYEYERKNQII